MVLLELLATQVVRELPVLLAHKAQLAQQDLLAQLDLLVQLDLLDH